MLTIFSHGISDLQSKFARGRENQHAALRRGVEREFYVISEVAVAFFFLDMLSNYSADGHLDIDPVWATTAALGALLFAVMWTRKKLRRRPH